MKTHDEETIDKLQDNIIAAFSHTPSSNTLILAALVAVTEKVNAGLLDELTEKNTDKNKPGESGLAAMKKHELVALFVDVLHREFPRVMRHEIGHVTILSALADVTRQVCHSLRDLTRK